MTAGAVNDNVTATDDQWWSAKELAGLGLPGVPTDKKAVLAMIERAGGNDACRQWSPANPLGIWRKREKSGGGRVYRMDVLPVEARKALTLRLRRAAEPEVRTAAKEARSAGEAWRWYDALPDKRKAEAKRRMDALLAVRDLQQTGRPRDLAMMDVAAAQDVSLSTLYGWARLVAGLDRGEWLPALAPRHAGRVAEADIPEEVWQAFVADYLRDEKPTLTSCYRRLEALAKLRGWTIPSVKTFGRRIEALPATMTVLAREGLEALRKLYPPQERDRSMFAALEAVNADGHTFDVFVKWLNHSVSRPVLVGFQDLYSGMILSWRIAESENAATVLAAFGDLVETWGIPGAAYLDNGRQFASKWFTGGVQNRYRFKIKETDPDGILKALGVDVHWTTPYSGQSKPIERAWRDFASDIAKHPAFSGAYTGNSPENKPESYGSRAVPIDVFERVVAEGIAEHNARVGRRAKVCGGRLSFAQAFAASYSETAIRRASPEQCRLWLLAAEGVKVRKDASVHLQGNRYWHERLTDFVGHKMVLRFDPDRLHDGVHVYRLDGSYVAAAPVVEAVGFADVAAARDHARARKGWLKAQKEMLKAERRLSVDDLATMLPAPEAPEMPEPPRIVRPVFGNLAAAAAVAADAYQEQEAFLDTFVAGAGRLRLVPKDDGAGD